VYNVTVNQNQKGVKMSVEIGQIYPYFFEKDKSRALFNAKVWIGDADTDPEFNQKVVVGVQESGAEVALNQPLTTNSGGGFSYNSSPVLIRVDPPYSMKVMNSKGQQEYYWPSINPTGGAPSVGVTITETQTLSDGQTTVTLANQLNGYINVRVNGDFIDDSTLVIDVDYTQTSSTSLELENSYPAGTLITVTQNDLSGEAKGPVNCYETKAAAEYANLAVGTCFKVQELGGASFIVRDIDYTKLTGDLTIGNGLVAELMPTTSGAFSVLWFGALNGEPSQDQAFDDAAERSLLYAKTGVSASTAGPVIVPTGNWHLDAATTNKALWFIESGAEFQNPANYTGNNVDNLSYLTGSAIKDFSRGDAIQYAGATDVQWLQDVRASILGTAVHTAISPVGKVGYLAASRTSDKASASEGTIPFKSYVLNDNETIKGVAYGMYKEAIRWPNAGTTFCEESNVTTYGSLTAVYPNQTIGNAAGVGANYWIGGPVGSGPLDDDYSKVRTSAAMVATGGSAFDETGDRLGFDTILVVLHDAMNTSPEREVFRLPTDTKQAYYSTTGVRRVYTNGRDNSNNGEYDVVVRSVGGVDTTYTFASAYFGPKETASKNLGRVGGRWLNAFLENAPDVVSDTNKKTSKRQMSGNEISAGLELARNVQMFKWISEVAEKGEDDAYYHTSVMAQEAWQILIDNGLEPTEYGFISNQSDNWSIMPTELSMLMSAALIAKQDELELRIQALEA
jgi:hypothetical protein